MVILVREKMNNHITFATISFICFILLDYGSCVDVTTPTEVPINLCVPSPCGWNAVCKELNGVGNCTCLPDYFGNPYEGCRPECVIDSDCALADVCLNFKCKDPCTGVCDPHSECRVIDHAPSCSCLPNYTGDPKHGCYPIHENHTKTEKPKENPCAPSPCGPNSECRVINNVPECSCLPNYNGKPPNCRAQCEVNRECPTSLACINRKCIDPCPGTCGLSAECNVINHTPSCICPAGYIGNAFVKCYPESGTQKTPVKSFNLCHHNYCGINAICSIENKEAVCRCIDGHFGDPYCGCEADLKPGTRSPCNPSPCEPNSRCCVLDQQPVCLCLLTHIGSPPNCRPECVLNSECAQDRACIRQKCVDPCQGTCGLNALCNVHNHIPQCTCPPQQTGNPFLQCLPINHTKTEKPNENPCLPSPCGPYSECRVINNAPKCSCLTNYTGKPPNCRAQCEVNRDCPTSLACINRMCTDPCAGTCGDSAECNVINHSPSCTCPSGYIGNAFVECHPESGTRKTPVKYFNPCDRNPCGNNTTCSIKNKEVVCQCIDGYFGDPYCGCEAELKPPAPGPCNPSPCGPHSRCCLYKQFKEQPVCSCLQTHIGSPPNCRPECVVDSDCPLDKACINEKCENPCLGTCLDTLCHVHNHKSQCSSPPGYIGDA